ncbi:hypothetical protein [Kitasatospora sp. NPDC001225]
MTRIHTRLVAVAAALVVGAGAAVAAAPAASAKSRCWEDIVTAMGYTDRAIAYANQGNLNGALDLSNSALNFTTTGSCAASPVIVDVDNASYNLDRGKNELFAGNWGGAASAFRSAYYSLEQASYTA